MRSTMTIPALGLMEFMSEIPFPTVIYGRDWSTPVMKKVSQSQLYDLIRRGLVHGIGSRSRLRRIHLIDTDNLAVVSYCRKNTRHKARFPVKSDAGATTYREHLSQHVIVQHHGERCGAWPHSQGGNKS